MVRTRFGAGGFGARRISTSRTAQSTCSRREHGRRRRGPGRGLASGSDDKIAWYENTDGAGSFGPQQVISTLADVASSVFAADVDGDGDTDVLSASSNDDKIAWYENTDGAGGFGPSR